MNEVPGSLSWDQPVYLEFSDAHSQKFYEVTLAGLTVTLRYGRIGTDGQTSSSHYATPEQAQAAAEKKINEKLRKGYVRSHPSSTSLPIPPVEENFEPGSIPYWLPEDFCVYTDDMGSVGIHAAGEQGSEARVLPTVNQYTGADGGYVAFYSRDPAKAVYSVGGGIYVVGQIRLKGRYIGRIFHPAGYENQDISVAPEFKELCWNTFAVEGWAGGDTGGWFGKTHRRNSGKRKPENRLSEAMRSHLPFEEIARPTVQVMAVTLQAGEEVWWRTARLRSPCIVQMLIISHSPSLSFNLMAGEDFAYHFNPRPAEGQIVQNTHIGYWGAEERLPLPQQMAFGREFELAISIQETGLAVYLNRNFLCHYCHRINPMQIDGLRLVCAQGSLQFLSVKISEPVVEMTTLWD